MPDITRCTDAADRNARGRTLVHRSPGILRHTIPIGSSNQTRRYRIDADRREFERQRADDRLQGSVHRGESQVPLIARRPAAPVINVIDPEPRI